MPDREKTIKELDRITSVLYDSLKLLQEQQQIVHPEPSCEMTYITDCCCDLCGVQLIREDNYCRGCGKPIEWRKWLKGDNKEGR